jgi:putative endonuclease
MEHPKSCVYILYSLKDNQFYIGYTTDFNRRMEEHHQGRSKSTAYRRPFIVLMCEYFFDDKDARQREDYFKTTAGKRTLRIMLFNSLRRINYPGLEGFDDRVM